MPSDNKQSYEFGEFRLQPTESILEKNGSPITLKPKAFLALVCLVESAGKLVEKSELLDKVWENAFVEEASVSKCIWEIRSALDDDSKRSKFIQTVPKRGYRFIAEVRSTLSGDQKFLPISLNVSDTNVTPLIRRGTHSTEPMTAALQRPVFDPKPEKILDIEKSHFTVIPPLRKSSFFRKNYLIIALALVVVAAGLIYHYYSEANPAVARDGVASLAILPLKPVIADTRDERIEVAIADALILKVGEAKNLQVKRLFSVRKFTDLETDPVAAGRDLLVDYVLFSNYQFADDRLRVISQLINVNTGQTEQTFRSEVKIGDIFQIQDVVSTEIGNALFARFGQPVENFALKRGTENEKAYELYLEGLYLVDKFTRDDSAKAVEILDRSTKIDPNFAAALAVKAQAYCQFAHLGGGNPTQIFSIAQPILEQALLLDTDNAVALTIRASISRDYYWNSPDAYRDVNKAIAIDPNYVLAYRILSGIYYRDGKFEEAVETQKRAVDMNPTDIWEKWFLAEYQIAAGNREEGVRNLRQLTETDPSFRPSYYSLWRTYLMEGDTAKAFEYFMKSKESWQDPQTEINRFKKIYNTRGWKGVLEAELSLMRSHQEDGKYSTRKFYIAELAAQVGQNDLAFQYLEEAKTFKLMEFSYVKVDPLLRVLHGDPRFDILVKTSGS